MSKRLTGKTRFYIQFGKVWQKSKTLNEVANKFGISEASAYRRAMVLRVNGAKLHHMGLNNVDFAAVTNALGYGNGKWAKAS